MRSTKKELTDWLNEDVVEFVIRRHKHDGQSYTEIAAELRKSGFSVTTKMLVNWVYESKRTK
jgi:hypothetical protein